MVRVTRVFVHDLDDEKLKKIEEGLKANFKVLKVSSSGVVPNYMFFELEGDVKEEVERLIASFPHLYIFDEYGFAGLEVGQVIGILPQQVP